MAEGQMKPSRRDFLKLSGAALFGLAGARFILPNRGDEPPVPLIYHGSRRHRYLAFTFDDCYLLNRLQDIEAQLDQFPDFHVTFFPIGAKLLDLDRQDKGIWKRLVDKGHEIGYHTFNHINLAVMSPQTALGDFDNWSNALNEILGMKYEVKFVRPTYDILSYTLDVLCRERGLVTVLFSIGGGGEPEVVMNAIRACRNGDIIQMHIRTEDFHTCQQAFPYLREQGIDAVTLTHLYNDLLLEQVNPNGCDIDAGPSLTRTCLE
jgi:peptidoglycan/xylan/chitin deacetylase (PgdA/CDA1 family)